MIHMSTHVKWFSEITDGASGRAAGRVADVSSATLNRQLSRGELDAEMVIAIARGYHRSPVTALVETGYLTADEAEHLDMIDSTKLLTDQQLVRELARRIDSDESAWAGMFDVVLDDARQSDYVAVADSSPDEDDPDHDESNWDA